MVDSVLFLPGVGSQWSLFEVEINLSQHDCSWPVQRTCFLFSDAAIKFVQERKNITASFRVGVFVWGLGDN